MSTLRNTILAGAFTLAAIPGVASAAFLNNWQFDWAHDGLNGNESTFAEFMDIVGTTYAVNTIGGGGTGTFQEWGTFIGTGYDGTPWGAQDMNMEATAVLTGGGNIDLNSGQLSFTSGTLNFYLDSNQDYGTTAGTFGADNGTNIATLSLVFGTGFVDASGIPNGLFTLAFSPTTMAAGYFFDENGNDLSLLAGQIPPILFGFSTTNASYIANPSQNVIDEIAGELAGVANPSNTPPGDLFISNNGQWRWAVPEPGALVLMGMGLLGLGFSRRRRS